MSGNVRLIHDHHIAGGRMCPRQPGQDKAMRGSDNHIGVLQRRAPDKETLIIERAVFAGAVIVFIRECRAGPVDGEVDFFDVAGDGRVNPVR